MILASNFPILSFNSYCRGSAPAPPSGATRPRTPGQRGTAPCTPIHKIQQCIQYKYKTHTEIQYRYKTAKQTTQGDTHPSSTTGTGTGDTNGGQQRQTGGGMTSQGHTKHTRATHRINRIALTRAPRTQAQQNIGRAHREHTYIAGARSRGAITRVLTHTKHTARTCPHNNTSKRIDTHIHTSMLTCTVHSQGSQPVTLAGGTGLGQECTTARHRTGCSVPACAPRRPPQGNATCERTQRKSLTGK
jgi:hypothetical protein